MQVLFFFLVLVVLVLDLCDLLHRQVSLNAVFMRDVPKHHQGFLGCVVSDHVEGRFFHVENESQQGNDERKDDVENDGQLPIQIAENQSVESSCQPEGNVAENDVLRPNALTDTLSYVANPYLHLDALRREVQEQSHRSDYQSGSKQCNQHSHDVHHHAAYQNRPFRQHLADVRSHNHPNYSAQVDKRLNSIQLPIIAPVVSEFSGEGGEGGVDKALSLRLRQSADIGIAGAFSQIGALIGHFVEQKGIKESTGASDEQIQTMNHLTDHLISALSPHPLQNRVKHSLHQQFKYNYPSNLTPHPTTIQQNTIKLIEELNMPIYHCQSSISLFTHFQFSLSCLCWLEYLPDLIISTLNQIILQRLNSHNQMRNHRLEINIEQLEKYQHQQPDTYHPLYPHSQQQHLASQNSEDGKPSVQDQPQDEGYDEGQEQQAFDDRSGGQASQLQQSSNRIYQSVETFGNNYDIKKQLSKLAQFSNHQSNNNQQQKYKLTETPLDSINFNRAQHSQLRLIELQKSNADDEVNRIINKVLMKDRQTGSLRAQDKAQKHSRKIDKINQELLSQNTRLIERVNSLQKKIQRLAVKMRVKTKSESRIKHENIPNEINKQLKQRLKKYKQKLSQALHLNSKLSSRHKTEKSISRLNGQLNRDSTNNRVNRDIREDKEMNSSSLGVMSTIRSNTLREDLALSKRSKKDNTFNAHLHEKAVCQKCHKKILKDAKDESRQKRGLFSPVLQFKNYEIKEEVNNLSESLAESKMLGKQIKDSGCQTEQNQGNKKRRVEQLDGQQRRLQQMVKANNARIQQHQELLFRLIDYG